MSLTLLEAAKAKLEGKRVERIHPRDPHDEWSDWDGENSYPGWIFRIAPEPKKKVKLLAWINSAGQLMWFKDHLDVHLGIRVPSEDKEVEIES